MKIIDVSEIEAHDDHRWDNVTLGPVTIVLALALAAQTLFGFGCGDGQEEDEQEDEVPAEIARSTAHLASGMPDYLWTEGRIEPIEDGQGWPMRTGGFNKWGYSKKFGGIYDYMVAKTATAVLSRPSFGSPCQQTVPSNNSPALLCQGKVAVCPRARVKAPRAYSNSAEQPRYDVDKFLLLTRDYVWASSITLTGNTVTCTYKLDTARIQIAKQF